MKTNGGVLRLRTGCARQARLWSARQGGQGPDTAPSTEDDRLFPCTPASSRDDIRVIGLALLVVFGVIVAGMTSLALIPFRRLPAVFHRLWHTIPRRHNLELLIGGLRQHGKSAHLTINALLCSFAIHVLVFTAGFCIAQAIHLDATYGEIIVVLAVVICVVSLPISIGGHGVREGAFVLMFAAFGIISIDRYTGMGQEPAILFSLLFFALLSVWSFIGGLIYLTFDHAYHNAGSSAPRYP